MTSALAVSHDMRVKCCGITRRDDAALAVRLGAWAVGFIFQEKSPRFITAENAALIATERVRRCGVFVDAPVRAILETARTARLTTIQLHGDESPDACREIGAAGFEVIKAFRPASPRDVDAMAPFAGAQMPGLVGLLIDAPPKAGDPARGGTGRLADWALATSAKAHGPVILSGGLTPANVADAVRAVGPYALDVSSGLEDAPGLKNHDKMKLFFENVRGVT